jgi:TonB family protein
MRVGTFLAVVAVGVVGGALTSVALADTEQQGPATVEELSGWQDDLERVHEWLEKGGERRARRAQRVCYELFDATLGRLGQQAPATDLVGDVLFYLAVAGARLGEVPTATWHWYEAQNVKPQLRSDTRLSQFADVERFLRERMLSELRRDELYELVDAEGVEAPEPLGMSPISYPGRARQSDIEGTTEVVLVIDTNGVPTVPLLRVSSGVPGFDVAVMEAARLWTFAPAARDGQPVEGAYVLTARFSLG